MKHRITIVPLAFAILLALTACTPKPTASVMEQAGSSTSSEASSAMQAPTKPLDGWTLHLDAKKHFTDNMSDPIAHHYCKGVSDDVTQCLLFASDAPDAQLVDVEVIVSPELFATFDDEEKKMWHYHKDEIPKVEPVMPDLSAEEAAEVAKSIEETYGKVYILRNPAATTTFMGDPYVTILK